MPVTISMNRDWVFHGRIDVLPGPTLIAPAYACEIVARVIYNDAMLWEESNGEADRM